MPDYEGKVDLKNLSINTENILTPFQRQLLEKKLQEDLPSSYRQRIQIMLLASEGKSQTEICRILKCCPATVRYWMHIARSGMAHQWQDCPIGRPKAVNSEYLQRLQELVNNNPRDYGYSFERWTGSWLSKHLAKEFGINVTGHHINRLLKQMGLSTRSQTSNKEASRNANNNRILITDLKSENTADSTEFSSVNLQALGKDLDIYGSKSVRAVVNYNAVQRCNRIFSFRTEIPKLSQTI